MTGSCAGSQLWVDVAKGEVSRDVFVDDDIYRTELKRLFNETWGYLAHETELSAAGDYVVRKLGDAEVVVTRDRKGNLQAFLNSCRHRGSRVCRANSGSTRNFVCPYHGWTYDQTGALITTTFDRHLPKDLDKSTLGLPRVPRLETYKGLIFGSWNADVVSIDEFIGEFAWYLDPFLSRTPGGMEVLAPPHRWRVKSNWKVGALNFVGDSQHILTTHVGPLTLDPVRAAQAGFATAAENSFQVVDENSGHGCTLTYLAPGLPEEAYQTHPRDLVNTYRENLKAGQIEMLDRLRVIVGTIFPNLSFIETQVDAAEKAIILRQWQPISGTEMEVLSWVFAEKEATAEYKSNVLRKGIHNFGAAGVFEQDDGELWASATTASNNSIARQFPYSFHTAVPYWNNPDRAHQGPCTVFRPADTEVAQLGFMRRWAENHDAWRVRNVAVTAIDGLIANEELRRLKTVEQFLFREARILDHRDYEGWLGMLTDDMRYVVRAQEMRDLDAKAVDYILIDEGGASLRSRIDQIRNARLSRAENPPSLARRFISNVEITGSGAAGELNVLSYVMAFRARGSVPQGGFYVGQRTDLIRMVEGGLRLARREVLLDHAVLFDGALTTLL